MLETRAASRRHLSAGALITEARDARGDGRQQMIAEEAKNDALVKRWARTLAKCPEIPKSKISLMAHLFENQFNHWNPEGQSALLMEAQTTTGNIADFTRFALPLLRKSYSRLIADNLVGVQPMSQPASLIFYLRYRYGTTKGQTIAGTQIMRQNTAQNYARQNGWAIDPYYSSQEVRGESATINGSGMVITHELAHRPVLAGTVVVEVFESAEAAAPNCDDAQPCLRVGFNSAGQPDAVVIGDCTAFTDILEVETDTTGATEFDHATGEITVTLAAGSFPAGAVARVNYEYDLEGNPFQPELTLSLDSDSVAATTRKLKTSWSLESAQDLKSVHGLNPEQILTDLMADEMVAEIDREILNDLILAAGIRATHNFATAAGASVNFTDRNIALWYKTLEVANIIHRTTLRGPANWMVSSADLCSKYEQLNDFRASDAMVEDGVDVGIASSGTLSNKLHLFKDPLFPNCKVLMGFKGKTAHDAGYFYAPYVPLVSTPTVLDPNSYSPTKGVMTRYGKKLVEDGSLYYATISVSNL